MQLDESMWIFSPIVSVALNQGRQLLAAKELSGALD
jgi:hypothetical protein